MTGVGDLGFTLLLASGVSWLLVQTLQLGAAARFVSLAVIAVTLALILVEAARQLHALSRQCEREAQGPAPREFRALAWVAAIVLLIVGLGGPVGTGVTLAAHLRLEARASWLAAVLSGAVLCVLVELLHRGLGVPMPAARIFG